MKKNKIITISILGLLLLIPFMTPARAAPAFVQVVEEEHWGWTLGQYGNDVVPGIFTQIFADNLSGILGVEFNLTYADSIDKLWADWSWDEWTNPQTYWPHTVTAISAENTSDILMADWNIPDMITYSVIDFDLGYEMYAYPVGNEYYTGTRTVVNDTASFALQNIYGQLAFSPYAIMGAEFAPATGVNWTEFVADVNWGMNNFWGGNAVNVTATEEANGYSLFVPALGFGGNSLSISINVSYTVGNVLNTYSFAYGSSLAYYYSLAFYAPDAVAPVITDSPSNFAVAEGYTGENISWTATDLHPGNYTITRDSTPVVTPTPWTNGTEVTYNIPDGLTEGFYTFEITFEDMYSNSISETVNMTVFIPDSIDPVITSAPADITKTLSVGDIGEWISWTATDLHAATYIIKVNGTTEVFATAWVSGTPVNYYAFYITGGVTTYEITFSDVIGNTVSDSVTTTISPPSETTPPPGIPGFEPMIVIGIIAIGSIGLIVLKKKKK